MSQTLEQKRAAFAWEKVQEVKGRNFAKGFKNLTKAAPALVMNNGLMQALAFYQSRDAEKAGEAELLVKIVFEGLAQRKICGIASGDFAGGMKALHQAGSSDYLRATDEALEILRWLRQFADAVLTDGSGS